MSDALLYAQATTQKKMYFVLQHRKELIRRHSEKMKAHRDMLRGDRVKSAECETMGATGKRKIFSNQNMLLSRVGRDKLMKKSKPPSYGPKTPAQLRLNQLLRETKKSVAYRDAKPITSQPSKVTLLGKNPLTKEYHQRVSVPSNSNPETILRFPSSGIYTDLKRSRLNRHVLEK